MLAFPPVGGTVAFVSTPETGHFARMRPLIAHVAAAGRAAAVFTDRRFRADVEGAGGTFRDLYGRYPIEEADGESQPVSCRHVSYAGFLAEEVAAEIEAAEPTIVVYDSFAVVGLVAARLLHLPHVCLCSGHDVNPARFLAMLPHDPRVKLSPRCHEAVARLRDRYGIADASPFSFVSSLSPHLNVYGEPPEYLDPKAREAFAPVSFLGSLARLDPPPPGPPLFGDAQGARKVYVSFGTVIWRYYAKEAVLALQAIGEALSRRGDVRAVVSLGGNAVDVPGLASKSVRVESYVDQWRALHEADLFVTHHGLNSTHEAAYCRVPMLSYPFFWDQPALAAKCRDLGIAVPLAREPRAPITAADVDRALAEVDARKGGMRARLDEARSWEERVVAGRLAVTRRILALGRGRGGGAGEGRPTGRP
jgi:UDP:flavonoid glycosyltransferase YjiC (YdhE family)